MQRRERSGARLRTAALLVCAAVAVLPLMMGHRTPETLTASLLMMVLLACGAAGFAIWSGEIKPPSRNWLTFAGIMTALVVLYVLPLPILARLFGPYPETLQDYPGLALNTWSPDPGATLRGWAAFVALFVFAWLGRALPGPLRHWVFLSIVGMALFQAVYGLLSHAGGVDTIFGIWPRNNPEWVHGSYSNRNLFGAYLALTWPLAVGLWFVRGVPGLHRLPLELRVTGSVLCGAIIGAAMLGSGSRLG